MFGTATTFSYHNPSSQNAKGLFSSIAIPSGLPQLMVTLPLSGYFTREQDRQTQQTPQTPQTPPPSQQTIPPQNTSHSAPQQPIHNNKRKQQRKSLLQNSFSAAIASTFVGGNMGNILALSLNNNNNSNGNSDSNSNNNNNCNNNNSDNNNNDSNNNNNNDSANKRSSVVDSSPPPPPNPQYRRKKQSNKINRKKIDQAIAFSAFSVEEDHQGNPECANDLYFLALEQLLEAFPIQNDQSRRLIFLHKLKSFLEHTGLIDEFTKMTETNNPQLPIECDCTLPRQTNYQTKEKGVSDLLTNAVVTSAVALKQSPIPDAILATVNYTTKIIKNIDEAYELQDKAWKISRTGINMALDFDQQYNVHEKVGNFCFTTIAAIMKAGIAYKDAPSYSQMRNQFCDDSTCIITENE